MTIPDEPLIPRLRPSLVVRRPGASAAQQAAAELAKHPIRSRMSRLLHKHTDERAWRVGAKGEELVGKELAGLASPPWYVFHDIPVGTRGANIDHLVIGPAGAFTVNAKNLTGKVSVTARTFRHNGYRTDYLPKAHREAVRASALLGVEVRPVIAVICDEFNVKVPPTDVDVVARRWLRRWLDHLPARMSPSDAFAIARRADDPATWTGA